MFSVSAHLPYVRIAHALVRRAQPSPSLCLSLPCRAIYLSPPYLCFLLSLILFFSPLSPTLHLFFSMSVYLSLCLSVCVCLSASLSACFSVCLSICLLSLSLSLSLSLCSYLPFCLLGIPLRLLSQTAVESININCHGQEKCCFPQPGPPR